MKRFVGCLLLLVVTNLVHAQSKKWVVAGDGSGDFLTVQAAVDAVPAANEKRIIIYLKKGVYKERLVIPKTVSNVAFVGEDEQSTIITFDNYNAKKDSLGNAFGTSGSSSVFVDGDNISFEHIAFENSSGPVGQAVAVNVTGNKVAFKNCRFLGFQDTLYTKGSASLQYYKDCYIEGTVDFIFGAATALFENCELRSKGKGGYVTAASTTEGSRFGYVFKKCKLVSDSPTETFFLGRPWRPFAKTVFIDCELGAHIKPEGWNNWSKLENEQTTYYAEYHNSGPGADTSKRAAWSHQLTDEEAKQYTTANILGDWKPF
ncbi:MAG: pectinesterase family protein [Bacteroidota bacterium]